MSDIKFLKKLYKSALKSVSSSSFLPKNIELLDNGIRVYNDIKYFESFNKLYIFSVGKAGLEMAKVCEDILGDYIYKGVAVSNQKVTSEKKSLATITHFRSTHPVVSKKSIIAADALIETVQEMRSSDFFIFCLSGGASALIEKPIDGLHLSDFQKISQALLVSGIDIKALNTLRKAISQIKGGKLAQMAKADGVVLLLSDVIGDDPKTIGSAPMYSPRFPHHIVANNQIALQNAAKTAKRRVKKVTIVTNSLDMPSKKAANFIAKKIAQFDKKHKSFCLLFGGETTTVPKGKGRGGRNQELALRLLLKGCVKEKISILCAGSDGIDGNSLATGAFLDSKIYKRMQKKSLNPKAYLKKSDSYSFFKSLGYDLTTGVTGTNVMDFIIIVKQ